MGSGLRRPTPRLPGELSGESPNELLDPLHERVAALRRAWTKRYGWTHVAVELELDDAARVVHVRGELASSRLHGRLARELSPPPGLRLHFELRTLAAEHWRNLPAAGLELLRRHPNRGPRELATQIEASDGPVAVLADLEGARLLRARDGTMGWTTAQLGDRCPPRPLASPRMPAEPGTAVLAAARARLGTPYRLGACGPAAIDCSALVQRCYLDALGLLLPRHSHDQLAVAGRGQPLGSRLGRAGELLFLRTKADRRAHVGIASGLGTVVHAAPRRAAVVEQSEHRFRSGATWLRGVDLDALVAWAEGQAGRDHVELPPR